MLSEKGPYTAINLYPGNATENSWIVQNAEGNSVCDFLNGKMSPLVITQSLATTHAAALSNDDRIYRGEVNSFYHISTINSKQVGDSIQSAINILLTISPSNSEAPKVIQAITALNATLQLF